MCSERYFFTYKTLIGDVTIASENNKITKVDFCDKFDFPIKRMNTDLLQITANQIEEYLKGDRKTFDVPIMLKGTDFQKKVWSELCLIPYGETRSYKQIAENIGNFKAFRAVGMANNKNPIMILIPCHRVIGSNGSLVGYAKGLEVKKRLLDLEKFYK